MSVVIETLVFCDGCDENGSADDRASSAKVIRAGRKGMGWIQVGSKDYCGECVKKLPRSKSTPSQARDRAQ